MDEPLDVGGFSWQEIAPPLTGAKARAERAKHHMVELDTAARDILDDLDERVRITRKPNGDVSIGLAKSGTSHTGVPLAIIIGEIVYNLRSGLDLLVYDLAVYGRRQAGQEDKPLGKTQFPMEDEEADFDRRVTAGRAGRGQLAWVQPEHVEAIRAVQPHAGCKWTAILRDISNQDKHRFLSELRLNLEVELAVPEEGQKKTDVNLALGIYLHPWVVPLPETLQLLQRQTAAFIDAFDLSE